MDYDYLTQVYELLSEIFIKCDKLDKAKIIFLKEVEILKVINPKGLSERYLYWADVCLLQKNLAECEKYLVLTVEILEKEERSLQIADNYEKLAIIFKNLGKLVDAETAIVNGIKILEHFGETDQTLYSFYLTLANIYDLQERLSEAGQIYVIAINGLKSPSDGILLQVNIRLSVIYQLQKRYSEAVVVVKSAIDLIERNLREFHNILPKLYKHLADAYSLQKLWSESEVTYTICIDLLQKEKSERHLDLSYCYEQLAFDLIYQMRQVEAEAVIVKGIDLLEQHFGEAHHKLYVFYHLKAYLYYLQGRLSEATTIYLLLQ